MCGLKYDLLEHEDIRIKLEAHLFRERQLTGGTKYIFK